MKTRPVEPSDRERFLAAVAEQVPVDRVVELYLFQPIRQGGVESGVAVIAAASDGVVPAAEPIHADAPVTADRLSEADTLVHVEPTVDAENATVHQADPELSPAVDGAVTPNGRREHFLPRYTVFTAHYRHVLKGPERGRWEVSVVAEADAPLAAIGAVVRGVQRRAGDVDPPEHITGDALREALTGGPSAPRRD